MRLAENFPAAVEIAPLVEANFGLVVEFERHQPEFENLKVERNQAQSAFENLRIETNFAVTDFESC